MYKQTEEKYKLIKLGNGDGSLHDLGCYLVSLTNGLLQKGYSYTPEAVNDILKAKGLWTGTTKNLIDVAQIVAKWGDVFTAFKRVDPWGATPTIDEILKPDIIAIGEVDPRGIGGSAKNQHFVLITKKATNGHAIIFDPWRGIEEIIDTHWANYGFIKSLRLFTVKPHVEQPQPQPPSGNLTPDQAKALEQVQIVKDRDGHGNLEGAARAMNQATQDVKSLQTSLNEANLKIENAKLALS